MIRSRPVRVMGVAVVAAMLLLVLAHGTRSRSPSERTAIAAPAPTEQALTPAQLQPAAQPGAGRAEILWDEWGTPHVFADDTEGLFRAFGWAQMQSHGNLLLRLYAQARGDAAQYGGPDFLESDRAVRTMALHARGQEWYAAQTPAFRRNIDAFAAGVNEYAAAHPSELRDTFTPILPITGPDVLAHVARVMFIFVAGESNCAEALPVGGVFGSDGPGSNAWGIGPSRTASGNAMLLANPHLVWSGEHIFYETQLAAPGMTCMARRSPASR